MSNRLSLVNHLSLPRCCLSLSGCDSNVVNLKPASDSSLSILLTANLGGEDDGTSSLLDLGLGEGRDESGLDDERQVGESALSEDLAVAERERVDDGDKVTRLLGELLLLVRGDKGPHYTGDRY